MISFWRKIRNELDYSPYPEIEGSLKDLLLKSIRNTENFLNICTEYLQNRGVDL